MLLPFVLNFVYSLGAKEFIVVFVFLCRNLFLYLYVNRFDSIFLTMHLSRGQVSCFVLESNQCALLEHVSLTLLLFQTCD